MFYIKKENVGIKEVESPMKQKYKGTGLGMMKDKKGIKQPKFEDCPI